MDDIVDVAHREFQAIKVADVTYEVPQERVLGVRVLLPHLELLEFISRKNDELFRSEILNDSLDQGVAKRTGAAGDKDRLAVKVSQCLVVGTKHGRGSSWHLLRSWHVPVGAAASKFGAVRRKSNATAARVPHADRTRSYVHDLNTLSTKALKGPLGRRTRLIL